MVMIREIIVLKVIQKHMKKFHLSLLVMKTPFFFYFMSTKLEHFDEV